jgi:hypothetical protein
MGTSVTDRAVARITKTTATTVTAATISLAAESNAVEPSAPMSLSVGIIPSLVAARRTEYTTTGMDRAK